MEFGQTEWVLGVQLAYVVGIISICLIVIFDTRSVSKTLAYLLLVIFVPIAGAIFYFSFGINYRKRKIYSKKLIADGILAQEASEKLKASNHKLFSSGNLSIDQNREMIQLLSNKKAGGNPILPNNEVEILLNGEAFFPLLMEELKKAKHHIHIQYYIYENDTIGNQLKDLLIRKASEGVVVRFIYDDFGSKNIRGNIVKELNRSGVRAVPFNKIKLLFLANRLNYRNHRKIVVIDGKVAFTGGINVCDKYINNGKNDLFWRDTNVVIKGPAIFGLQQVFLSDWNFCSKENLGIDRELFPIIPNNAQANAAVQVVSNGPDSDLPNILYAIIQAIQLAKREVLITTPYYIPDGSLQQSLIIAALSGVDVKLLVPKKGDSKLVNRATQAYFDELLEAGVKIYLYEKGFVHAKTFVTDRRLASIGTANLDLRSFDLNFEVNAIIYDEKTAIKLAESFDDDLLVSEEITSENWNNRPRLRKLTERLVRLISPFL
ncbi:cardiolipin synthase [Flagellimonas aequoris]|uniref:Cardiolipin synthase n=1 Tax=Flagellimonas aequoris TaxID=2306997 RepID=A0A418N241_9FLAO|nr:cardiolipin synthase [Allomuricauda aequoris]RIV67387.1 cardiolipin synthase [Allomuricauda aequoris]TXJ99207.1 cardiolipin synthase [Allomuricauda aequoris]